MNCVYVKNHPSTTLLYHFSAILPKMKVIILAGGYATRLHPITLNKSKPLIKINDKPIIEHIIAKLHFSEIDEIFIVTNEKFYTDYQLWSANFTYNKPITIMNDGTTNNEDRLGAVGDIDFVIEKQNINDDLLIIAGDNLFEDDLQNMMNFLNQNNNSCILVNDISCFEKAKQLGIVNVNENNKIISFVEKPEQPKSTLAATCVYAIKKNHLRYVKDTIKSGFQDKPGDFIRHLSENEPVFALPLQGKWFDIGTLQALNEANAHYDN